MYERQLVQQLHYRTQNGSSENFTSN